MSLKGEKQELGILKKTRIKMYEKLNKGFKEETEEEKEFS